MNNHYTRRKTFIVAYCFLVLVLSSGASIQSPAQEPQNKSTTDPYVEKVNGAELWVQYNPQHNQTIYILTGAQKNPQGLKGLQEAGHIFEIGLLGSSEGRYVQPAEITLDLTHSMAKKSMWHFPGGTRFSIEADGKRIFDGRCKEEPAFQKKRFEGCVQQSLEQISLTGTTFIEGLILSLPFSAVQLMGDAKNILITIDKISFSLDNDTIHTFRIYTEKASGKP